MLIAQNGRFAGLVEQIPTIAPSFKNLSAVALPIPAEPPVTIATLPSNFISACLLSCDAAA